MADPWVAMGDPSRRRIVRLLAQAPASVTELAQCLPISRPAVSQHLKILKTAGLVTDRAEGTRRIYQLNPVALAALRDQLDAYWQRTLDNYAAEVARYQAELAEGGAGTTTTTPSKEYR